MFGLKEKKDNYFEIYLDGFDGKNDSLKISYRSNGIDLLESIFIEGDIKLNLDILN